MSQHNSSGSRQPFARERIRDDSESDVNMAPPKGSAPSEDPSRAQEAEEDTPTKARDPRSLPHSNVEVRSDSSDVSDAGSKAPARPTASRPTRTPGPTVKSMKEKWENPGVLFMRPKKVSSPRKIEEARRKKFELEQKRADRKEPVAKGGSLDPDRREPWDKKSEDAAQMRVQIGRGSGTSRSGGHTEDSDDEKEDAEVTTDDDSDSQDDLEIPPTLYAPLPERPNIDLPNQPRPPNRLPLHLSAFEYALIPYLSTHPSSKPFLVPPSPTTSSSSAPPPPHARLDPEEISITSTPIPLPPENLLPAHLQPTLTTQLKTLHVRTALTRCTILSRMAKTTEQSTAWHRGNGAHKIYSKMANAADHALVLARELQSDGLQARCYYWKGRACGAMRYWDEAGRAFESALRMDPGEGRGGFSAGERGEVRRLEGVARGRDESGRRDGEERWGRERVWWVEDGGRGGERVLDLDLGKDKEGEGAMSPAWDPDMERLREEWWREQKRWSAENENEKADREDEGAGEDVDADTSLPSPLKSPSCVLAPPSLQAFIKSLAWATPRERAYITALPKPRSKAAQLRAALREIEIPLPGFLRREARRGSAPPEIGGSGDGDEGEDDDDDDDDGGSLDGMLSVGSMGN